MYSMYVPCIELYAHVHNNYLSTNCHARDIHVVIKFTSSKLDVVYLWGIGDGCWGGVALPLSIVAGDSPFVRRPLL